MNDRHITGTGKVRRPDGQELSIMPTSRMSGEDEDRDWARILKMINDKERGLDIPQEIVVRPGGELVAVDRSQVHNNLSVIPPEIMASERPDPESGVEIRRLDPTNRDEWRWVPDPVIPGWHFKLKPAGRRFTFFTFRAPAYGNSWLLSLLTPNLDELTGHATHVIPTQIGRGAKVPIVCREPGRLDHKTIREIRGTAGKFAVYHTIRQATGVAPFSA